MEASRRPVQARAVSNPFADVTVEGPREVKVTVEVKFPPVIIRAAYLVELVLILSLLSGIGIFVVKVAR